MNEEEEEEEEDEEEEEEGLFKADAVRRRKVYSKLTQSAQWTPSATAQPRCRRRKGGGEGLFKAKAVKEQDSKRDRATRTRNFYAGGVYSVERAKCYATFCMDVAKYYAERRR